MTDTNDALTVLALTCSLKPSPSPSSTDLLAQQLLDALAGHGRPASWCVVGCCDRAPTRRPDHGRRRTGPTSSYPNAGWRLPTLRAVARCPPR